MAKNKLQKFDEMTQFPHVFQYPFAVLKEKGFPLKGSWGRSFFHNNHPIVLELGCGKGEYTVGLGTIFPEKNFIGVDIKGARMWNGAKESFVRKMINIAFLRTHIELIDHFFAPGEVSEIWLTFPDPQIKKVNKRLTSTRFMGLYKKILSENGLIHLKTDSPFMYKYTCAMVEKNALPIKKCTEDLYHSDISDTILSIKTFYEQQWLDRGMTIKYIQFGCGSCDYYVEPQVEIEPDTYRSFNRSRRSSNPKNEK